MGWFTSDNVSFSQGHTCRSKPEEIKTANLKEYNYKCSRVSVGCKSCVTGGHVKSLHTAPKGVVSVGISLPKNKRLIRPFLLTSVSASRYTG